MAKANLLDIAKLNGNDAAVGLVEENLKYAPEVGLFPARTISGTSYRTVMRTGLPSAGFRSANDGFDPTKSTFVNKLVETYIFGGRIEVDKAVADAYEDGASAWQAIEAMGIGEAAIRALGSQVFYGTGQDAKGFHGLKALSVFGTTTPVGGDAFTINAGGTTADTASSVYAVKFGPQYAQMVVGMGGSFDLPEFRLESITGENSKQLPGYVSDLCAWVGMQVMSENSVRRIANLTADSGKGLTDSLLASVLETFPVGVTPDAFFMSRRSRRQLQASRTVTLFGQGKGRPDQPVIAPLPTEYEGIPIVATDSILNTDAIESA